MATRTISDAGGDWNTTAAWFEGVVPVAADDVVATGTSGNLVVTASSVCRSFVMTNYVGTLSGIGTWSVGDGTAGAFTLVSGMTITYTGALTFISTVTGNNITLDTKVLASAIVFNGVGGVWTLQDTFNNGTSNITLARGTLDTNGVTVTSGVFSVHGVNTRVLTLGASTVNCTTWAATTVTLLTFNVNTSTINIYGALTQSIFLGGGLTYNNVTFNSTADGTTQYSVDISGANTYANLTITGSATKYQRYGVYGTQTITGTLTITGNSLVNRVLILTSIVGTAYLGNTTTLTAAVVSLSNVDFQDIAGAGVAAPFTGASIGNALGSSGITFTEATTRYAVVAGNWSAPETWSTTSGGIGGATAPLCHDTVILDANSAEGTYTADRVRVGADIDFTGFTRTLVSGANNEVHGSLTLGSGMATSGGSWKFLGRGSHTYDPAGRSLTIREIKMFGGTLTLQSDIVGNGTGYLYLGTFNANNKNLLFTGQFGIMDASVTLIMGSGTWEFTGSGTTWRNEYSGATVIPNTSTIKFTNNSATNKTFMGAGKTYYNFWNATAGAGTVDFTGSNTFNDIKINAGRTQRFTAGTTTTVTSLTATGAAGNLITLGSVTAATHTLKKAGAWESSNDYLSISYSTATPADTWYAGVNSTDGGNNSGWIFSEGFGINAGFWGRPGRIG